MEAEGWRRYFPLEAKCPQASDGPLQTEFPGKPAGAIRGEQVPRGDFLPLFAL